MITLLKAAGHSRKLPTGRRIAKVLQAYWKEQAREVAKASKPERLSLDRWTEPMVETLLPMMADYWRDGFADSQKRLERKGRKSIGVVEGELLDEFDVFNPAVLDKLKTMTFKFAKSTNATSMMRVHEAYAELRRTLAEGLERGEALKTLTGRVQEIFADPQRAQMIAASESSRALHAGQNEQEIEAGVEQKRWLASRDACPICLELNGMVIGIEESFMETDYGPVYYPPAHPL